MVEKIKKIIFKTFGNTFFIVLSITPTKINKRIISVPDDQTIKVK